MLLPSGDTAIGALAVPVNKVGASAHPSGSAVVKVIDRTSSGRENHRSRSHNEATASSATPRTTTADHSTRERRTIDAGAAGDATIVVDDAMVDPLDEVHLSSSARSAALCQCRSGSFSRHFMTMRSSAGGASGCRLLSDAGVPDMMAEIRLA